MEAKGFAYLYIQLHTFISLVPSHSAWHSVGTNKCLLNWGRHPVLTYPPFLVPFSWLQQDDLMPPIPPSVFMLQPLTAALLHLFPSLSLSWGFAPMVSFCCFLTSSSFLLLPFYLSCSCYPLISFEMCFSHSSPLWGPLMVVPAHSWPSTFCNHLHNGA